MTTSTNPKTYTRAQLCEALGLGESNFDRVRGKMEGAGFPKRLPGLARWSRACIDAWIAANGDRDLMYDILVGPEPGTTAPIEASSTIQQRYGGIAA